MKSLANVLRGLANAPLSVNARHTIPLYSEPVTGVSTSTPSQALQLS